jgi:hypothetical protein
LLSVFSHAFEHEGGNTGATVPSRIPRWLQSQGTGVVEHIEFSEQELLETSAVPDFSGSISS